MSYSEVFGGGTINPAQRTYLSLVSAVDVTLQWPIEQQIGGDDVAADIIDADMTAPGLNINLSDARQVSNGFTSLIVNVGSQDFTVRDALGGSIVAPVTGTAWFIYLTDNSTEDGTWSTFQLGATISVADAAALAGAGIKAISTTLNQRIFPTLTGVTPITWVDADRAQFTIWTGGVGILDLPVAGTVGSDWFSMVRNEGSGILTLTPPAGTIDSAATVILNPGESCFVVTDGTDYFTIGLGSSTTVGFDFVQIDVSGSGDFVLSGVQLNRIAYEFIGALTGNRKIVVPNTIQQYWVANFTTGAFTFEVATAAQVTPVQIIQNNRSIYYCDGVDVVDAETGTLTPPIAIGQGGTGAVTAAGALANLGGISSTRQVNTAALSGLGGGGDLSMDRNLVLDVDNLAVQLTIDPVADVIAFYDDDAVATVKVPFINLIAGELADASGNIVLSASGSSAVQLRSITNSDVVPRQLLFTHQDGTVRGRFGWDSFSEEFVLQNLINANDADIEINTANANTVIEVRAGGGNAIRLGSFGVNIRGPANNNALLRWTTTAYGGRASIGFPTSDVFTYTSLPNSTHRWEGEDNITATVAMLELNPNTGCSLYFKGDGLVARTALLANGGFEVNNTVTGAGFERALTTSDLDVETGTFNGLLLGFTVSPIARTFSYSRINDTVTITVLSETNGTSNANFMTTTVGVMPASIRPAGERRGYWEIRDNAVSAVGSWQMDVFGTIRWSRFSTYVANSFTAAGQKTLRQFSITYNINQT